VDQAMRQGRWAPRMLMEMIEQQDILVLSRKDPDAARFFSLSIGMVMRLIINEGGWGVSRFDLLSDPVTVTLDHSQEARWAGPSSLPTCYLSAGVMAGYASRLMRRRLDAREIACAATGAPRCLFELTESPAEAPPHD